MESQKPAEFDRLVVKEGCCGVAKFDIDWLAGVVFQQKLD